MSQRLIACVRWSAQRCDEIGWFAGRGGWVGGGGGAFETSSLPARNVSRRQLSPVKQTQVPHIELPARAMHPRLRMCAGITNLEWLEHTAVGSGCQAR